MGELKKLTIESYADPEFQSHLDTFRVMFNPTGYSTKHEVEYEEDQGRGTSGLPQSYKQTKPTDFSISFVLDGTGASGPKVEVTDEVDKFLEVVQKYNGEEHRPPFVRVSWGTLLMDSVFKSAGVQYTLFRADGSPLRAKITATFTGFVADAKRVAEERASSPDLTHVHTVAAGENLPLLAHRYYGDYSLYLELAEFNGIDSLRRLEGGQKLLFPPLSQDGRRG